MTERDFQRNMKAANTFRRLADGNEAEFWAGYQRGLRRLYHGENFGTEDEHLLWMASMSSSDESRRIRGRGYRAGFEGQTTQQAILTFLGPQTYHCLRCEHEWRPRITETPKRCPACKSPYWDKPYSRADLVREAKKEE